jgi:hypothetical protein
MSLEIVILEDCIDRQTIMTACLADRFRHYPVRFFEAAAPMIAYLESKLKTTIVIALDHDLEFIQDANGSLTDPGTGRDVANFLADRPPTCPVVIHSTNSPAAVGIKMTLDEANWTTYRVVPFGDLEWISEIWIQAMRRAIVDTAAPEIEPTHSN